MDKNEFCCNTGQVLSAWKDRISAEFEKAGQMDPGDKQRIRPIVDDLMMLEAEMGIRIIQFQKQCPA